MNKYFISALVLALSLTALAAPKKAKVQAASVDTSLRATAVMENKSIDEKAYKKALQASEAQQADVSSFLKLKDPTPELRNRSWFWTFAFKFQNMQPLGTGKTAGYSFDLESYGSGVMPSMELGFLMNAVEGKRMSWASGLAVNAGYMTQSADLIAPSGYEFSDTRLNTTLASAVWCNRFKSSFAPKISFLVSPEVGFVTYTQTNQTSTLANFTQQNNYWGVGVGADYAFTKKWGLMAQYKYRDAKAENIQTTNLQKNNVEIGTQVTW